MRTLPGNQNLRSILKVWREVVYFTSTRRLLRGKCYSHLRVQDMRAFILAKSSQVYRLASLIEIFARLFSCFKLSNMSYGPRHRSVNPWSKNRIEVTTDWSLFEIGAKYVLSLLQYSCWKLFLSPFYVYSSFLLFFLFFSPPLFSFIPFSSIRWRGDVKWSEVME